jgi:putative transposase
MVILPKHSVSEVVEMLKKNTSRSFRMKFGFLDKLYWDGEGIWRKGYFVSTVGINEGVTKRYIEMQGGEDTGQAELELQKYHACKGEGIYLLHC